MADRILLEGIQFYGFHGVAPEERAVGHHFEVDLEVSCDLRPAGASDDVDDTVDYGELARRVVALSRERRFHLLEALAATIAEDVLARHPRVERVRVRVRKLLPPVDAVMKAAVIEIERGRE